MSRFMLDEGIFDDERVSMLPIPGRWLFARMIALAEKRSGVGRGRAAYLLSKTFPGDPVTVQEVESWLAEMARLKLALFFKRDHESFYILPRFTKHRGYIKDMPKRVLPLPPPELLRPWKDSLKALAPEYALDGIDVDQETTPDVPRALPRVSPGDAPAEERRGDLSRPEEEEGEGRPGAPPAPAPAAAPPPPPASQGGSAPAAPMSSSPETDPLREHVARLAARARETITPRGSVPAEPDAAEDRDWRTLIARELGALAWWVDRLCELMGQMMGSKFGPGGSGPVLAGPADLLRPSDRRNPASPPMIAELLRKFPSKLPTPEQALKRAKRHRAQFELDRTIELEQDERRKLPRDIAISKEAHAAIAAQVQTEADARFGPASRAGPAPGPSPTATSSPSSPTTEGAPSA